VTRERTAYGIDDLDPGVVTVARVDLVRGRVASRRVELDAVPAQARAGVRGGCYAAVPVRQSFSHELTAPFSRRSKAVRVLPTLLDLQLPFALDDCLYTFAELKAESGSVRALAVGARTAEIERRLGDLVEKGIDPLALDHEGLALWSGALRG